jgi:hypothetical protein
MEDKQRVRGGKSAYENICTKGCLISWWLMGRKGADWIVMAQELYKYWDLDVI